ncbi:MAG: hypothetical protein JWQ12_1292 [Glaciihabitans sp.]|nr:hypothetical protein [Glaciihabitans sp.]
MTSNTRLKSAGRAVGSTAVAFSLTALVALAPPPPASQADLLAAYNATHAQTLTVSKLAPVSEISRDTYTASAGYQTLADSGTNYDWAKLVLLIGNWPMSNNNVTVLTRWMRQENGPNNWWNRDNPLNNGWGSGGNSGTGSYPSLMVAAREAADALHSNPGYSAILQALAANGPTANLEHAIWASPWSSSHYANGTHWSSVPVPRVKAPASAW